MTAVETIVSKRAIHPPNAGWMLARLSLDASRAAASGARLVVALGLEDRRYARLHHARQPRHVPI